MVIIVILVILVKLVIRVITAIVVIIVIVVIVVIIVIISILVIRVITVTIVTIVIVPIIAIIAIVVMIILKTLVVIIIVLTVWSNHRTSGGTTPTCVLRVLLDCADEVGEGRAPVVADEVVQAHRAHLASVSAWDQRRGPTLKGGGPSGGIWDRPGVDLGPIWVRTGVHAASPPNPLAAPLPRWASPPTQRKGMEMR